MTTVPAAGAGLDPALAKQLDAPLAATANALGKAVAAVSDLISQIATGNIGEADSLRRSQEKTAGGLISVGADLVDLGSAIKAMFHKGTVYPGLK